MFLCGITSAGNEENLRAMIAPLRKYVDGLQFTFHEPTDAGYDYLFAERGEGRIVRAEWCQRHGYSMTHYLWQGTMEPGDIFIQLDSAERLSPEFFEDKMPGYVAAMRNNVAMIANYGKGLVYRFNEQLEFRGSPHWYAANLDGFSVNEELKPIYFWNVRGEQRDKFQFVSHYLKYYLYPAGSNHCLLGLEKNGDPQRLFPVREARRIDFRKALLKRGVPLTVAGVKTLMAAGIDAELKPFFEQEKILNDAYRHLHLGQTDFPDDHDFKNMIHIEEAKA